MERGHKFDPTMIERLGRAERLLELAPERILQAAGLWTMREDGDPGPGRSEAVRATGGKDVGSDPRVVVDLGSGPGFVARGVSRLLPQAVLYAVDVAPELLKRLEAELSEEERRRIRTRLGSESEIAFDDDEVDFLFMTDVYHELVDAPRVLAEARRVIRPGGILLVVDWAKDGTDGGPPDDHRVPVEVLEREVAAAGFHEVRRRTLFTEHHAVRGLAP
ncbi:MAG: class I SAM-dependent methyltransferase [Spirochaetaceae bacterium]